MEPVMPGKKTYLVSAATIAYALGGALAGFLTWGVAIPLILGALGLSALRGGVSNAVASALAKKTVLPALLACFLLVGCASKLDPAATAQNLANVETITAENADLHVKAGSAESVVKASAEKGKSAVRLAKAMAEAVR